MHACMTLTGLSSATKSSMHFWKQRDLLTIFTYYESFHPVTHAESVNRVQAIRAFSQKLDPVSVFRSVRAQRPLTIRGRL